MCCKKKILIAEDDGDINALVVQALLNAGGYTPVSAFSGTEALLLLTRDIDMVLLDLTLPGMDGASVLRRIRESEHADVPVIVITAVPGRETKLNLLDAGADDYMVKPFDIDELVYRIRAVFRRVSRSRPDEPGSDDDTLLYKEIRMDITARTVTLAGVPLTLTLHEFDILKLLMSHPQKVFSRLNLYESVWNEPYMGDESTVNVHISNLRGKLAAARTGDKTEYIKTVWGIGFKLAE